MIGIRNSTKYKGNSPCGKLNKRQLAMPEYLLLYFILETCGGSVIINNNETMKHHLITSPGYPKGYENNLNCVWSIYNPDRKLLSFSFNGSSIRPDDGCADVVDFVVIHRLGDVNYTYVMCILLHLLFKCFYFVWRRNLIVYLLINKRMGRAI